MDKKISKELKRLNKRIGTHEARITKLQKSTQFLKEDMRDVVKSICEVKENIEKICSQINVIDEVTMRKLRCLSSTLDELQEKYRCHLDDLHFKKKYD